MTKQSAPLVTRDLIESDQWQAWLDAHDKFKFEDECFLSRDRRFTAYKSRTGHWTAQRRMHGRLRHQYLGKPQDMSYEKLQTVAEKLGVVSETIYETGLKATLRKADKELLAELQSNTSALTKSHKDELGDYETKRALTSQSSEEIANLKTENEELKQQLAALQKKYEYEADCAKRYYQNWRKFPGIESERNYFKSERDKLRAELENLKSQPPVADLIKQYETDYETIKQSLPKSLVTRDWVHFWRFKTWLESL